MGGGDTNSGESLGPDGELATPCIPGLLENDTALAAENRADFSAVLAKFLAMDQTAEERAPGGTTRQRAESSIPKE